MRGWASEVLAEVGNAEDRSLVDTDGKMFVRLGREPDGEQVLMPATY